MNHSTTIVSLFFLISLALPTTAQNGFKVIQKARHSYEKGHHKRALKLLLKAEQADYGFCGNAWMDADRAIHLLRAQIYMAQKDYLAARNSLDALDWEYVDDNLDSIRIRTYQMEYGKDSLSSMLDTSFANTRVECGAYNCSIAIPLRNGRFVKLKVTAIDSFNLIYIEDEQKRMEYWKTRFKASNNYQLLTE